MNEMCNGINVDILDGWMIDEKDVVDLPQAMAAQSAPIIDELPQRHYSPFTCFVLISDDIPHFINIIFWFIVLFSDRIKGAFSGVSSQS